MFGQKTKNTITGGSGNIQAGGNVGISPKQYSLMLRDALERQRKELEAKFSEAKRADHAERELLAFQIRTLQAQKDETERRLANVDEAYAALTETIKELERLLRDATEFTASIGANRIAEAKTEAERGKFAKADAIFAEVEKFDEEAIKRSAEASFGRGLIAEQEIRWNDAAKHFMRSATLHPTFESLRKCGILLRLDGRYAEAILYNERLAVLADREFGNNDQKTATALNNLAEALTFNGNYQKSEELFKEVLRIDKATIGEDHIDHSVHLNNFGNLMRAQGRFKEAEKLYRQSVKIDQEASDCSHLQLAPHHAPHLANLSGVLLELGRINEAERYIRTALEIDEATIGKWHPDYASDLNVLAIVLMSQGRLNEARGCCVEAIEVGRVTIGEGHPVFASCLNTLGLVLEDLEEFHEAEIQFREALKIGLATVGEAHRIHATDLNNLARVIEAQGRLQEAEEMYRKALTILNSSLGENHPNTLGTLGNLNRLLAKKN